MISSWFDFHIWQIRIDRFVCKNRRKTSNWRLFRNFDDIIVIERCLWFIALSKSYYYIRDVDFHMKKSSRIELLQNKCFQKYFKNAFRRRDWSFFVLISIYEILLNFLTSKSRNQIYWNFAEFFDVIRCSYDNLFRCICTFKKETTKLLFSCLHIHQKNKLKKIIL